jgi:ATP-dependent Clp protease adapter protein ClpS
LAALRFYSYYPYEMAETKVSLATMTARENGFPLKTTMERE